MSVTLDRDDVEWLYQIADDAFDQHLDAVIESECTEPDEWDLLTEKAALLAKLEDYLGLPILNRMKEARRAQHAKNRQRIGAGE